MAVQHKTSLWIQISTGEPNLKLSAFGSPFLSVSFFH